MTAPATHKVLNNLALAVSAQGLIEALRLGHSGGLSTEQILSALDRSMLLAFKDFHGADILAGSFGDTRFSAHLMAKDTRLMIHTSRDPLPAR
jgi:3-hydroxyisobutyrate dehydrogenase